MNNFKKLVFALMLFAVATLVVGCGGDSETNRPAIPLTASAVVSQADVSAHTHSVSIPFTDFSSDFPDLPADAIFQYRSSTVDGHSHVFALTQQQMIDINNGMKVILTSSSPDTGAVHTHNWTIRGGDLLYEKYCYNCHSNDKRKHNPMNVTFNSSQSGAVRNPSGAPLSTSSSTTPDPNYLPADTVSLDGAALYATNCASCHGPLATTSKPNRTFDLIKGAITNNIGGMSSVGALTDAQVQAIADALVQ